MARGPILPPGFKWERGPYEQCATCGEVAVGMLSAGEDSMTMRCSSCRDTYQEILPELNKQVIYLDQNLFSILYRVKTEGRLPIGHEALSREIYERIRRVVLLQQAVLPHSNLHSEETIIFSEGTDLRAFYEHVGGNIHLVPTHDVEIAQYVAFAEAYVAGKEPVVDFDVRNVLQDDKDGWLRDIHIRVKANYGAFAGGIRARRQKSHAEMTALYEHWKANKLTFNRALEAELAANQYMKREAFLTHARSAFRAHDAGDMDTYLSLCNEPIFDEKRAIVHTLGLDKAPDDQALEAVFEFWRWERNRDVPVHRIACHLWAALATRFGSGQKKSSQGASTDIKAISSYAPYVDAMFVDREFAHILSERQSEVAKLPIKARIFSFAEPDAFIAYLAEIEDGTPADVREYAQRIYGIA